MRLVSNLVRILVSTPDKPYSLLIRNAFFGHLIGKQTPLVPIGIKVA
tara:strand:+ start:470 stop:610 length:141 start_codon:yes stop_codon:yes gene_type:complete